MNSQLILIVLVCAYLCVITDSLRMLNHLQLKTNPSNVLSNRKTSSFLQTSSSTALFAKNKWSKDDLAGDDYFDEDIGSASANEVTDKKSGKDKLKKKFKLDPETTFFEGPPSPTEILFPALSILTVIGIVPFVSAVARQFWVKYKFTSRRIAINSGIGGKIRTEVIYPDIEQIKFVYRAFGSAGDMVLFLKDGAKVELRHVPQFNDIYDFVMSKCDDECREKSMKIAKPAASSA